MANENLIIEYKQIIRSVQELLRINTEWVDRYKGYADILSKYQDPVSDMKSRLNPGSLGIYTSTSRVLKSSNVKTAFDLRYMGRSVADLLINENDNTITVKTKRTNIDIAGYGNLNLSGSFPWISKEGRTFRKFFNDKDNPPELTTGFEHQYEHKILNNLALKTSSGKMFLGIQPIRLGGCFFQMPTPLAASNARNNEINYAGPSGGGIDIIARVKGPKLCIIELKDSSERREDSMQAIKQAIAYATFIHTLLRCENARNKEWWKLFCLNGILPNQLIIKTVIMMPIGDYSKTFDKINLDLTDNPNGDKLELNYFFFDAEEITNVVTSL